MKITKKFIKDNPEIKLKELCPELFETKLEVGVWYKCIKKGLESLVCITNLEEITAYGFTYYGEKDKNIWTDNSNAGWTFKNSPKTWEPATPKEIKNALEKEALRKNFVDNLKNVNCLAGFNKAESQEYYCNKEYVFYYEILVNKLWIQEASYLDICIFDNGTWATIIKPNQMTKQEAEEKFNIEIV